MSKKLKIIISANELLKEKNYQQMSTAKIAKYAGVAEGTLYRYFKNKDEIFLEAMRYTFDNLHVSVFKDVDSSYSFYKNLNIVVDNLIGRIEREDSIYKIYYRAFSEIDNKEIRELIASWVKKNFEKSREIFAWAMEKGELSLGDDDITMIINWIWGTTELIIRDSVLEVENISFDNLKNYINKIEKIVEVMN